MFQIWQHHRGERILDAKDVEEIEAIIRAGDDVKWYIEYVFDTVIFGEELVVWGVGYKKEDGTVVIERGNPWYRPSEEDLNPPRVVTIANVDAAAATSCKVDWRSGSSERN
jgi:hypothetical protein